MPRSPIYGKLAHPSISVLPSLVGLGKQIAFAFDRRNTANANLGSVTAARNNSKPFIIGFIPPDEIINFIPFDKIDQTISGIEVTNISSSTLNSSTYAPPPVGKVQRVKTTANPEEVRESLAQSFVKIHGRKPTDQELALQYAHQYTETGSSSGKFTSDNYNFANIEVGQNGVLRPSGNIGVTSSARQELSRWQGLTEDSQQGDEIINSYWRDGVGIFPPADNTVTAWSGAFISYTVNKGNPGVLDTPSGAHSIYAAVAKNTKPGSGKYKTLKVSEVSVQPGDIIIRSRGDEKYTFEDLNGSFFESHGDIVTEVRGNTVVAVGGNLDNTVKEVNYPINSEGILTDDRFFAVLRIQSNDGSGLSPQTDNYIGSPEAYIDQAPQSNERHSVGWNKDKNKVVAHLAYENLENFSDNYNALISKNYPGTLSARTPEEFVAALNNGVSGPYPGTNNASYTANMQRGMDEYNRLFANTNDGLTIRSDEPVVPDTNKRKHAIMGHGVYSGLETDPIGDRIGRGIQQSVDGEKIKIVKEQTDYLRQQIRKIASTPPLLLLINPSEFNRQYQHQNDSSPKTRFGNISHRWIQKPLEITSNGVTAAQYAFNAEGAGGLTTENRVHTLSYQNLLSLLGIYKNNGIIYANAGRKGAHTGVAVLGFSIYIYYDSMLYIGSFDTFAIKDDSTKPYNMSYDFKFTCRYVENIGNSISAAGISDSSIVSRAIGR